MLEDNCKNCSSPVVLSSGSMGSCFIFINSCYCLSYQLMSEDYFFVAEYEISCGALQGHIEIGEVL
jgi:hypothetical protein